MAEQKQLEGLGGWLILVGLGIVLSPLIIIGTVFPMYSKVFSNGLWGILTTPGSTAYHPMLALLIIVEIVVNIGLVITWIITAIYFFSKKKGFPKLFIALILFNLAFVLVDAVAAKTVLPGEPLFNEETTQQFGRIIITALIWIPYMLRSKRVKKTFIH